MKQKKGEAFGKRGKEIEDAEMLIKELEAIIVFLYFVIRGLCGCCIIFFLIFFQIEKLSGYERKSIQRKIKRKSNSSKKERKQSEAQNMNCLVDRRGIAIDEQREIIILKHIFMISKEEQ